MSHVLRLGNTGLIRRPVLPLEVLWPCGTAESCAHRAEIARSLEEPATKRIVASMSKDLREIAMRDVPKDDVKRYRILCRLVTRTVPLGWGVATQVACTADGNGTPVSVDAPKFRFALRVDSAILLDTFRAARAAALTESTVVWTNPTLYRTPSGLRYYEAMGSAKNPTQSLSQVEGGREIYAAVDLASEQSDRTVRDLAQLLSDRTSCILSDALELIYGLVREGVLCSGPRAPLAGLQNSGLDELEEFHEFLSLPAVDEMRAALSLLRTTSQTGTLSDFQELNEQVRRSLANSLSPDADGPLLVGSAIADGPPIHIPQIVQSLTQTALNDLLPHFNRRDLPLNRFISLFESKFGNAQVPLMLAVDPDYGIDLFACLSMDSHRISNEAALVVAWERSVRNSEKVVSLTEADLAMDSAQPRLERLADGVAQVQILSNNGDQADTEPVAHLEGFRSGPTTRFYSRFLRDHLESATKLSVSSVAETDQAVVSADVLYVAADRLANISASPTVTKYVVLCDDLAAPQDCVGVPVGELLVSVSDGKLRLFAPSVGKWIEPRMNHPVNTFTTTRPAVAFLGYLERHNSTDYDFSWPALLRNIEYLPRVTYKRVIIALARWSLRPKLVNRISELDCADAIRSELENIGIPRLFSYGPGDKPLVYDQSSEVSMFAFAAELRKNRSPIIFESLLHPDGPAGQRSILPFPHQLHVPVIGSVTSTKVGLAPNGGHLPHDFYVVRPGGEWATIKLYANERTLDSLIAGPLMEWIKELNDRGLIQQWFFIRYRDPEPHIRVRLRAEKENLWSVAVPAFLDLAGHEKAKSRLHSVMIEPYVREVDRYGGPGLIGLHESIFSADSSLAVRALHTFGPENANLLTVAHWLGFLRASNLSMEERRDLLRSYGRVNMLRDVVRATTQKWRRLKQCFDERGQYEELRQYVGDVAAAYGHLVPSEGCEDWRCLNISSILHMSANRIAGMLPKPVEGSLLEVLARHYDELINRGLDDDF